MVRYQPSIAIHPAETLKGLVEEHHMNQKDVAKRTGISEKHISDIFNGHSPVTPETALKLERVFGVSATFWNNLQRQYDEAIVRIQAQGKAHKEITYGHKYSLIYPTLAKLGYVPNTRIKGERAEGLLRFFGVDSLSRVQPIYENVRFRKSPKAPNKEAVLAWLRCGEIEFQKLTLPKYDRQQLKKLVPELLELTMHSSEDFLTSIQEEFGKCGVAFIWLPYFKDSRIHGAGRWIGDNPLIQLSDRHKSQDSFWFTLLHEVCHILHHGKKETFVDYEGSASHDVQEENEADAFARNQLIPSGKYEDFVSYGDFTTAAIKEFARKIHIHPGIVAGRLAMDRKITFQQATKLRAIIKAIDREEQGFRIPPAAGVRRTTRKPLLPV